MKNLTFLSIILSIFINTAFANVLFLGDTDNLKLTDCKNPCSAGPHQLTVINPQSAATDIAQSLFKSSHAVFVVDATIGVTPNTRAHIRLLRQTRLNSFSLYFINTNKANTINAQEEIELFNFLLNSYELATDQYVTFYDANNGSSQLVNYLKTINKRNNKILAKKSSNTMSSIFYMLTEDESSETISISSGKEITLWVNGNGVKGTITNVNAAPGDVSELNIKLEKNLRFSKNDRIFMQHNGKMVGMGAVL